MPTRKRTPVEQGGPCTGGNDAAIGQGLQAAARDVVRRGHQAILVEAQKMRSIRKASVILENVVSCVIVDRAEEGCAAPRVGGACWQTRRRRLPAQCGSPPEAPARQLPPGPWAPSLSRLSSS